MKIVFCSNYLNQHQLPLCQAYLRLGHDFTFVADYPTPDFRLSLGYVDMNHEYSFVIRTYEGEEELKKAEQAVREADIVISGAEGHEYMDLCDKKRQVLFRYSERLFKKGVWKLYAALPYYFLLRKRYSRYQGVWMLAAGAYAAGDYDRLGAFRDHCLKWGYFPQTMHYEDVMAKKSADTLQLLWTGRFISWKHPELALKAARLLKEKKYSFHLTMIGKGERLDEMKRLAESLQLKDEVEFTGALPYTEVRQHMEAADIFLFTSDRQEGWGAVLNEAMNSGCAAVACSQIGSVPFLIKDGTNGMIYQSEEELMHAIMKLVDDPQLCHQMGEEAYHTITEEWNADYAAGQLTQFAKTILEGKEPVLPEEGPLSKALPIA